MAGSLSAGAVHDDNLFELGPSRGADILGDGDTANGPDWADLFDASGVFIGSEGLGSFFADDLSQSSWVDRTTYSGAGGSNKNNDPISGWHWDEGNTPAKDDLSNVYAYGVWTAEEHLVLYAGYERIANTGDSHIDLEFFHDAVGLDEAVPCNDPGPDPTPCNWVGERTVEDVIISMDFLKGGDFGTMTIREWNGREYVLDAAINGEGCNPADTVCGFNNGGLIDGGPWPNYDRHGNVITELPMNAFTEIGVDVTAILGSTPCLSTMLGKTRSSQSFTAELKDFAGPFPFQVCGASIQIAGDAVNEVGQEHTFTVTVNKVIAGNPFPADDGTIVTVDLKDANGAVSQVIDDSCGTSGTVGGTCTVAFMSDTAGTVTGHASANVAILDGMRFVETDGIAPNSGDAVKRFVDAQIGVTPLTATNEVNAPHDIIATVLQDDGLADGEGGDGVSGWTPVPDGTTVEFSFGLNTASAYFDGPDSCATLSGSCTVTINAPSAGQVAVHAKTTFSLDGVILTRETGTGGLNSADAKKVYVDAQISIAPTAANEVGHPHTFTVTVLESDGLGSGFVPAQGEDVDFILTPAYGAVVELDEAKSTCDDAGANTDANGQCLIVFTSDSTGLVEGTASSYVQVGGLSLYRTTDGSNGNSLSALKRFVAARLSLTPTEDANQVCSDHVITAHLEVDYGEGVGFVDAPDGEVIDFAIDDGPGTLSPSSCTTTGGDGTCTVILTSGEAGLTTVSASWTGDVITAEGSAWVSTDASPVLKRWVDARISVNPDGDNPIHTTHTFTVTLEFDYGSGFVAAPDGTEITDIHLTGVGSIVSETCSSPGTVGGSCEVTISSAVAGSSTLTVAWVGAVETDQGTAASVDAGSDCALKTWWAGSISVTKVVELGPFTTSAVVCFELARTDGTLYTTSDNPQCFLFGPETSYTFVWQGLTAGTYSLTETVTDPYVPMDPNPITGIVVDGNHRCVCLGTIKNPLPHGTLLIEKRDETGALWTQFRVVFEVYWCGDDLDCSSLEGLVATVLIPCEGNPVGRTLDEGRYLVREIVPAGWIALPDDEQEVDVVAGETASVTFQNIKLDGCSPTFWKTHPELWDGVGTDATVTIQTYDLFNAEFGITTSYSGLADSVTLLDALSLSGSELMALNRQAGAALPNADSGMNYPYTVGDVITLYQDAVGWIDGPETVSTAFAKLSAANALGCPLGCDPGSSGGGAPASWGFDTAVAITRVDE